MHVPEQSPQVAPELVGIQGPNATANRIAELEEASALPVPSESSSRTGQWEEARRQELREQGFTSAQIDAIFVRQHRQEVMAEVCRHWFLLFGISSFILGMLTIVMLVWLCFVWSKAYLRGFEDCDTLLTLWGYVLYSAMILNFAKSTSCGQRAVGAMCFWEVDANVPSATPLRVKLLNLSLSFFMFCWNAIGIHWARFSQAPRVQMVVCQEEGQGVIDAIVAFASVNIALTLFMFLNIIGLAYFFRMLLRMGIVQSSKAAPEGSLEASTQKVTVADAELADSGQCPICLEDFSSSPDSEEVLRTVKCQHYFHRACLKDWLDVNRDCPLCREDLAKPQEAEDGPVPV